MLNDNSKSYLHLHLIVFIWGFTAVLGRLISLDALPLVLAGELCAGRGVEIPVALSELAGGNQRGDLLVVAL